MLNIPMVVIQRLIIPQFLFDVTFKKFMWVKFHYKFNSIYANIHVSLKLYLHQDNFLQV